MKAHNAFCDYVRPKDSTAAMAILLLLFVIPSKPGKPRSPPLVSWSFVQNSVRWGIVFMRGGGLALAVAVEKSLLSCKISNAFQAMEGLSPLGHGAILIITASIVADLLSNTAAMVIFLPILRDLVSVHSLSIPLKYILAEVIFASWHLSLSLSLTSSFHIISSLFSSDHLLSPVAMATAVIMIAGGRTEER